MYPCNKQILEQLLTLIDGGECKLALKTWSEYHQKVSRTCSHCPYKELDLQDDCCMCLESKLRTLSLYEHGANDFENTLLNAARKLDQFSHQVSDVA